MIKICEWVGGSTIYGLKTPDSDKDIRYVFKNTEISKIIGLDRHEHQENKVEDIFGFELRFFFGLLKRGNTQAIEALFLDESEFNLITDEFKKIREHRYELISSEKLFNCLMGYTLSEKRKILGQISGQLGNKRKLDIEKYGYSYKNCTHALRLLRAGIIFFDGAPYPVNIVKYDKAYGPLILDIKQHPEKYRPDELIREIESLEEMLKRVFDLRKKNFVFNDNLVNELIYNSYMPILNEKEYQSIQRLLS